MNRRQFVTSSSAAVVGVGATAAVISKELSAQGRVIQSITPTVPSLQNLRQTLITIWNERSTTGVPLTPGQVALATSTLAYLAYQCVAEGADAEIANLISAPGFKPAAPSVQQIEDLVSNLTGSGAKIAYPDLAPLGSIDFPSAVAGIRTYGASGIALLGINTLLGSMESNGPMSSYARSKPRITSAQCANENTYNSVVGAIGTSLSVAVSLGFISLVVCPICDVVAGAFLVGYAINDVLIKSMC